MSLFCARFSLFFYFFLPSLRVFTARRINTVIISRSVAYYRSPGRTGGPKTRRPAREKSAKTGIRVTVRNGGGARRSFRHRIRYSGCIFIVPCKFGRAACERGLIDDGLLRHPRKSLSVSLFSSARLYGRPREKNLPAPNSITSVSGRIVSAGLSRNEFTSGVSDSIREKLLYTTVPKRLIYKRETA